MNYDLIYNTAENRVGVRDMFDTLDYIPLSSDLTQTDSGLFVNTINEAYLRPEVIDQYLEFAEGMNINEWDSTNNYGQSGAAFVIRKVNDKHQAFVQVDNSSEDNLDKAPEENPEFWESFLSYRLKQYRQSAVHEVINELTTGKAINANTSVIKNYNRLWMMNASPELLTLQNSGAFRCLNIVPNSMNSVVMEIQKIGLKLSAAVTVPFYLYHSDNFTPLQQFNVEITAQEVDNFVWKDLVDTNGNSLEIYSDGDQDSGGLYLFGFYESDLPSEILYAWQYNYYWPNYPITTPRSYPGYINFYAWQAYKPYYSFYPGYYQKGLENKPNLPDIGTYFDQGNYDDKIPFNLKLNIKEDHTNILIDNISRLDKLIQLKWAIQLLTNMQYTFRKNAEADKATEIAQILNRSVISEGVQGNFSETTTQGVIPQYAQELKRAIKDLTQLTMDNNGLVQTY